MSYPTRSSPGKMMIGSPTKRREMDLMKLMMSNYEVTTAGDSSCEFWVKFHGPKNTPYEGGVWQVHVELPETYPYKSPSIGFANCIFHPNVDLISGSVCLDVINQTWSPMYDLINVFEVFLPQLLSYPNPADPLNGDAAALLMKDPPRFAARVKEYVIKYARLEDAKPPVPSPNSEASKVPSKGAVMGIGAPAAAATVKATAVVVEAEDDDVAMGSDSEIEELEL